MLSADFFHTNEKIGQLFHIAMNGMAASDKMFTILDEPTSNLDTLNEAVILKVPVARDILAVVWVCHVVYFVFGVKTIREEE